MSDKEDFYDAEIAPVLADLNKKCQAHGMGFLAMVNYDDEGSIGRTLNIPENGPFILRLADTLARCWLPGGAVNVDGFMIALERHNACDCREVRFAELEKEVARLQKLIDSRPAINAGLPQTYIEWSQGIYLLEVKQAMRVIDQ